MDNDFRINIPSTLNDIKLSQWQQYLDILGKNKDAELTDFLEKKMLGIFCDVQLKDIDRIGLSVYDNALQHLSNILNSKTELVRTFKMTGTDGVTVEFGMIPNFDKMSYGEFIDLEKYLFVDKDFHRAMAVMYRPIKFKNKDNYLIHDYKGTEYLAEVMRDTPLDVALGARVFFYRLVKKLGDYTMDSILKQYQTEKEASSQGTSEESGEVIKQYLNLRKEMSAELSKLQHYQFTNV